MFILNVVNLKENHEVDAVAADQRAFIERYIDEGIFVVAGAKVPRTGGIIIVQGVDRARAEALAAAVPFVKHGLASVEVVEFKAVFVSSGTTLSTVEAR